MKKLLLTLPLLLSSCASQQSKVETPTLETPTSETSLPDGHYYEFNCYWVETSDSELVKIDSVLINDISIWAHITSTIPKKLLRLSTSFNCNAIMYTYRVEYMNTTPDSHIYKGYHVGNYTVKYR